MDLGTIGGIISGFIVIIIGILWGSGDLLHFADASSVFITIGGTTSALFVGFPLRKLAGAIGVGRLAFQRYEERPADMISTLVTFSEKARKEGLLALEDNVEEIDDEFLKKGIQLVVDGTDPELVRNIMETELGKIEERHVSGRGIFDLAGFLFPAFGMLGTLIGLILALRSMGTGAKEALGEYMAIALITTFYGSLIANLVMIPISKKLEVRNDSEILLKEIMLEGTLSIQSGDNPRIVKDKLASFLSPTVREELSQSGE